MKLYFSNETVYIFEFWRLKLTDKSYLKNNSKECCEQSWTSPGGNTHKTPTVRPPASYHENYSS